MPTTKPSVRLSLRHLGPVPAKKNSKLLTRGKLITKPGYQDWMRQAERSLESQLTSIIQTFGGEMLTALSRRCSIASLLFADDCWTVIPSIHIKAQLCKKGEEGADILIERIT